jgi:hypothetical protein
VTIDVCDVCALVDGDRTPKPVTYCDRCKANLCAVCHRSVVRRARAMMLRGMGRKA